MGNWHRQLERQRAGEIPGHIGSDEPVEHFLARTRAEQDTAPAGPTAAPVTTAEAAAAAFVPPPATPSSSASSSTPAKRAPRPRKTAAKKTTARSRKR